MILDQKPKKLIEQLQPIGERVEPRPVSTYVHNHYQGHTLVCLDLESHVIIKEDKNCRKEEAASGEHKVVGDASIAAEL